MQKVEKAAGTDVLAPRSVFVGMFDVLGFKNIVLNTPLAEVLSLYGRLLNVADWSSRIPVVGVGKHEEWKTPVTVVSDTLLLWADDEWESVQSFFASCSVLMAEALGMGWPLRGGIAFGECVLNRQQEIYVGPPIVKASMVEAAQDWVGAALDPSCFEAPNCGSKLQHLEDVKQWAVPTKPSWSGPPLEWALRWTERVYDPETVLNDLAAKNPPFAVKFTTAIPFARACTL